MFSSLSVGRFFLRAVEEIVRMYEEEDLHNIGSESRSVTDAIYSPCSPVYILESGAVTTCCLEVR